MKIKLPRLILEISIGLAIFWGVMQWQERNLLADDSSVQAPELRAVTLSGEQWQLSDYHGKNIVLYFFAPWCTICHISAGNLEDIYAAKLSENTNSNWEIVLVALSYQHREEVEDFVASHNFSMPVLLGNPEDANDWQISAFPTYYVVNKAGQITGHSQGYSTEMGLRLRTLD